MRPLVPIGSVRSAQRVLGSRQSDRGEGGIETDSLWQWTSHPVVVHQHGGASSSSLKSWTLLGEQHATDG